MRFGIINNYLMIFLMANDKNQGPRGSAGEGTTSVPLLFCEKLNLEPDKSFRADTYHVIP